MSASVYDIKQFYSRRAGRLVRRLLSTHIEQFWPEVTGLSVMGYGYAVPYLKPFLDDNQEVFGLMPTQGGVHQWPVNRKNLVSLSKEIELPFATESLDRILVIHGLEFCIDPESVIQELWRVLKSNGRLLLIVPNRVGLWARVDRTPFGQGTPYSMAQMHKYLNQNMFTVERSDRALFMPPFKSFLVLRSAYTMEVFGKYFFSGLAGLNIIEASKQIYSGVPKGLKESKKGRRYLIGDILPT